MISLKKIENFYFNLIFIKKKRLKHFHQNKFKVWSQHISMILIIMQKLKIFNQTLSHMLRLIRSPLKIENIFY